MRHEKWKPARIVSLALATVLAMPVGLPSALAVERADTLRPVSTKNSDALKVLESDFTGGQAPATSAGTPSGASSALQAPIPPPAPATSEITTAPEVATPPRVTQASLDALHIPITIMRQPILEPEAQKIQAVVDQSGHRQTRHSVDVVVAPEVPAEEVPGRVLEALLRAPSSLTAAEYQAVVALMATVRSDLHAVILPKPLATRIEPKHEGVMEVHVIGQTAIEALRDLVRQYPQLAPHLIIEASGEPRPGVGLHTDEGPVKNAFYGGTATKFEWTALLPPSGPLTLTLAATGGSQEGKELAWEGLRAYAEAAGINLWQNPPSKIPGSAVDMFYSGPPFSMGQKRLTLTPRLDSNALDAVHSILASSDEDVPQAVREAFAPLLPPGASLEVRIPTPEARQRAFRVPESHGGMLLKDVLGTVLWDAGLFEPSSRQGYSGPQLKPGCSLVLMRPGQSFAGGIKRTGHIEGLLLAEPLEAGTIVVVGNPPGEVREEDLLPPPPSASAMKGKVAQRVEAMLASAAPKVTVKLHGVLAHAVDGSNLFSLESHSRDLSELLRQLGALQTSTPKTTAVIVEGATTLGPWLREPNGHLKVSISREGMLITEQTPLHDGDILDVVIRIEGGSGEASAAVITIRPGLEKLYPDVFEPVAMEAVAALAPLSAEVHATIEERNALRNERARIGQEVERRRREGYYGRGEQFRRDDYLADKRKAQLHFLPETNEEGTDARIEGTSIRVRDARRGNFIGSPIPDKIKIQYVQLTGPGVKPKKPELLDPGWEIGGPVDLEEVLRLGHALLDRVEKGERLDQLKLHSFNEWLALGVIGDLRNVAHQLLSGADSIMEDLEDAAGQLSLMALDNQRALKLAVARDPLFLRVAKMVMGEGKQAGKLRIDGKLIESREPLTNAEWEAWKSQLEFTLQIVRVRGLHLDDRHLKTADGHFASASIVDEGLFWANNYQAYLDRGLPMVSYLAKTQRAKEAALWDQMFQNLELFLRKKDPRVKIGMLKVYVLDEQHQASFEGAEIRAALSQGGSKVEIVELMNKKGEFQTKEEYQDRLEEARELDAEFLARTGVDPHDTESRFLGFNTGRWDKINSVADENAWDYEWIPPNIEAITMRYKFMAAYERRVFQIVNVPDLLERRALWQGGMEPQIPVGAPEAIKLAMERAIAGATRERDAGAEGKWAAHPDMVHILRQVWAAMDHAYLEAIQATATPPTYTQADEDALRELDPDPKNSPITVRGARNLISVGIQMGNAHLRGFQAAALKPADFFERQAVDAVEAAWRNRIKDQQYQVAIAEAQVAHIVERRAEFPDSAAYEAALQKAAAAAMEARLNLFLMEDMATGEIRLTILWNWVHKGAKFTEDDPETGVKAGDTFTEALFRKWLEEEYQKLLAAAPKNVHEESKTATLPTARYITERYVLEDVKCPWYIDLLNIALDQSPDEARNSIDRFFEAWKKDGTRLTANVTFGTPIKDLILGVRSTPGIGPITPSVVAKANPDGEQARQDIAKVPESLRTAITMAAEHILQRRLPAGAPRGEKQILLRGILSRLYVGELTRPEVAAKLVGLLEVEEAAALAEANQAPVPVVAAEVRRQQAAEMTERWKHQEKLYHFTRKYPDDPTELADFFPQLSAEQLPKTRAEAVLMLRGPLTMAQQGLAPGDGDAELMRELMFHSDDPESYVYVLGVLNGHQAVKVMEAQHALQRKGIRNVRLGVYLSGWQIAATRNVDGLTLTDQSVYSAPASQVAMIREVNNALERAATSAQARGETFTTRDWRPLLVVDMEAPKSPLHAFVMATEFIKAGARVFHIERQNDKICGHGGGGSERCTATHVDVEQAVRLAADVLGVDVVIIGRDDATHIGWIANDDPEDRPYILGRLLGQEGAPVAMTYAEAVQRGFAGEWHAAKANAKAEDHGPGVEPGLKGSWMPPEKTSRPDDPAARNAVVGTVEMTYAQALGQGFAGPWTDRGVDVGANGVWEPVRNKQRYYKIEISVARAIHNLNNMAPDSDAAWEDTHDITLEQAKTIAEGIHAEHPGKPLVFNTSPNLGWADLEDSALLDYQRQLARLGYKLHIQTLFGFVNEGYALFERALRHGEKGLVPLAELQRARRAMAKLHPDFRPGPQEEAGGIPLELAAKLAGQKGPGFLSGSTEGRVVGRAGVRVWDQLQTHDQRVLTPVIDSALRMLPPAEHDTKRQAVIDALAEGYQAQRARHPDPLDPTPIIARLTGPDIGIEEPQAKAIVGFLLNVASTAHGVSAEYTALTYPQRAQIRPSVVKTLSALGLPEQEDAQWEGPQRIHYEATRAQIEGILARIYGHPFDRSTDLLEDLQKFLRLQPQAAYEVFDEVSNAANAAKGDRVIRRTAWRLFNSVEDAWTTLFPGITRTDYDLQVHRIGEDGFEPVSAETTFEKDDVLALAPKGTAARKLPDGLATAPQESPAPVKAGAATEPPPVTVKASTAPQEPSAPEQPQESEASRLYKRVASATAGRSFSSQGDRFNEVYNALMGGISPSRATQLDSLKGLIGATDSNRVIAAMNQQKIPTELQLVFLLAFFDPQTIKAPEDLAVSPPPPSASSSVAGSAALPKPETPLPAPSPKTGEMTVEGALQQIRGLSEVGIVFEAYPYSRFNFTTLDASTEGQLRAALKLIAKRERVTIEWDATTRTISVSPPAAGGGQEGKSWGAQQALPPLWRVKENIIDPNHTALVVPPQAQATLPPLGSVDVNEEVQKWTSGHTWKANPQILDRIRIAMGGLAFPARLRQPIQAVSDIFTTLVRKPENAQVRWVVVKAGVLGTQMARYYDQETGWAMIAIDEAFYRATIGGGKVTEGNQRVFAERGYHELRHNNTIGSREEEVAEETDILLEDLALYEALGGTAEGSNDPMLEAFLGSLSPDVKPFVTGKGKYQLFARLLNEVKGLTGEAREQKLREGLEPYAQEVVGPPPGSVAVVEETTEKLVERPGAFVGNGKAFGLPLAPRVGRWGTFAGQREWDAEFGRMLDSVRLQVRNEHPSLDVEYTRRSIVIPGEAPSASVDYAPTAAGHRLAVVATADATIDDIKAALFQSTTTIPQAIFNIITRESFDRGLFVIQGGSGVADGAPEAAEAIAARAREWKEDPRWRGVVRTYTSAEVQQWLGTFGVVHTVASEGAYRLWDLTHQGAAVLAMGALTGDQAVQQVQAGLPATYVSGAQTAKDDNPQAPLPDIGAHSMDSVLNRVTLIAAALEAADRNQGKKPVHDFMAPIIVDGEGGWGSPENAFVLTRAAIKAGASAIQFEDGEHGHLVAPSRQVATLQAARLAADIAGVRTLVIARTNVGPLDTLATTGVPEDVDLPFVLGETTDSHETMTYGEAQDQGVVFEDGSGWTEDGGVQGRWKPTMSVDGHGGKLYTIRPTLDAAIARALAYAPHADVIWRETAKPDLEEARAFADAIHARFPGKLLAYNLLPSVLWEKITPLPGLTREQTRERFIKELETMGYRFVVVTNAGSHALTQSMFTGARSFSEHGLQGVYQTLLLPAMAAKKEGYTGLRTDAGGDYFDTIGDIVRRGIPPDGAAPGGATPAHITHTPSPAWARRLAEEVMPALLRLSEPIERDTKLVRGHLAVIFPDGQTHPPAAMGRWDPLTRTTIPDERTIHAYASLLAVVTGTKPSETAYPDTVGRLEQLLKEKTTLHDLIEGTLREFPIPAVVERAAGASQQLGLPEPGPADFELAVYHAIAQGLEEYGHTYDGWAGWTVDHDAAQGELGDVLFPAIPAGHPLTQVMKLAGQGRATQIAYLQFMLSTAMPPHDAFWTKAGKGGPLGSPLAVLDVLLEATTPLKKHDITEELQTENGRKLTITTIENDLGALRRLGLVEKEGRGIETTFWVPSTLKQHPGLGQIRNVVATLRSRTSQAATDAVAPQIAAILSEGGAPKSRKPRGTQWEGLRTILGLAKAAKQEGTPFSITVTDLMKDRGGLSRSTVSDELSNLAWAGVLERDETAQSYRYSLHPGIEARLGDERFETALLVLFEQPEGSRVSENFLAQTAKSTLPGLLRQFPLHPAPRAVGPQLLQVPLQEPPATAEPKTSKGTQSDVSMDWEDLKGLALPGPSMRLEVIIRDKPDWGARIEVGHDVIPAPRGYSQGVEQLIIKKGPDVTVEEAVKALLTHEGLSVDIRKGVETLVRAKAPRLLSFLDGIAGAAPGGVMSVEEALKQLAADRKITEMRISFGNPLNRKPQLLAELTEETLRSLLEQMASSPTGRVRLESGGWGHTVVRSVPATGAAPTEDDQATMARTRQVIVEDMALRLEQQATMMETSDVKGVVLAELERKYQEKAEQLGDPISEARSRVFSIALAQLVQEGVIQDPEQQISASKAPQALRALAQRIRTIAAVAAEGRLTWDNIQAVFDAARQQSFNGDLERLNRPGKTIAVQHLRGDITGSGLPEVTITAEADVTADEAVRQLLATQELSSVVREAFTKLAQDKAPDLLPVVEGAAPGEEDPKARLAQVVGGRFRGATMLRGPTQSLGIEVLAIGDEWPKEIVALREDGTVDPQATGTYKGKGSDYEFAGPVSEVQPYLNSSGVLYVDATLVPQLQAVQRLQQLMSQEGESWVHDPLLKHLTTREVHVLGYRFRPLEPLTREQTAVRFLISPEEVEKIETQALAKIGEQLRAEERPGAQPSALEPGSLLTRDEVLASLRLALTHPHRYYVGAYLQRAGQPAELLVGPVAGVVSPDSIDLSKAKQLLAPDSHYRVVRPEGSNPQWIFLEPVPINSQQIEAIVAQVALGKLEPQLALAQLSGLKVDPTVANQLIGRALEERRQLEETRALYQVRLQSQFPVLAQPISQPVVDLADPAKTTTASVVLINAEVFVEGPDLVVEIQKFFEQLRTHLSVGSLDEAVAKSHVKLVFHDPRQVTVSEAEVRFKQLSQTVGKATGGAVTLDRKLFTEMVVGTNAAEVASIVERDLQAPIKVVIAPTSWAERFRSVPALATTMTAVRFDATTEPNTVKSGAAAFVAGLSLAAGEKRFDPVVTKAVDVNYDDLVVTPKSVDIQVQVQGDIDSWRDAAHGV